MLAPNGKGRGNLAFFVHGGKKLDTVHTAATVIKHLDTRKTMRNSLTDLFFALLILGLALFFGACGRPPGAVPVVQCTDSIGGSCITGADSEDRRYLDQVVRDLEPGDLFDLTLHFKQDTCTWAVDEETRTYWGSRYTLIEGLRLLIPSCALELEASQCQ